jgi:hypothetical protein
MHHQQASNPSVHPPGRQRHSFIPFLQALQLAALIFFFPLCKFSRCHCASAHLPQHRPGAPCPPCSLLWLCGATNMFSTSRGTAPHTVCMLQFLTHHHTITFPSCKYSSCKLPGRSLGVRWMPCGSMLCGSSGHTAWNTLQQIQVVKVVCYAAAEATQGEPGAAVGGAPTRRRRSPLMRL